MDPINYLAGLPQIDLGRQFLGGLQAGAAIGTIENTAQKQQLALQEQKQYQADIQAVLQDPTPQNFAAVSLKYPKMREAAQQAWNTLSEGDRKAEGDTMAQAYSAMLAGRKDLAQKVVQSQITARKNSGLDTSQYESALQLLDGDPKQALGALGFTLSHINDPKAFATQFGALGGEQRAGVQAPVDLRAKIAGAAKAEADARTAGVQAGVAEATIPEQIAKPASDLATAEQNRRLAEFNAQIAAADSETKRGQLTLERDKYITEQGLKQQDLGQGAQAQIDSAQMALDNIKSLRDNPLLKETTGNSIAGIGTVLGQMLGNIPGTENKDFRGQLESLKSQIFLPAVQQVKGMGALSNAEGEKLTASVAALDANMSPTAFKNALGVVERYMTKGLQKGLANRGVPTQGGGFVANHPTYGTIKEGDVNRLMRQYPGATREQIMSFLNFTGAK